MDKDAGAHKKIEADVWNAIAAFEQILEAIPNDRVALETLYDAYDQIGDKSRALDYLTQLARSIAEEGDVEAAPEVINKLNRFANDSLGVRQILERLERMLVQNKMPTAASLSAPASTKRKVDITNELALAWNLLQANELTQEEYSSVVHDLSENSSKNSQVPISVLHVLNDRAFKNLDRVMRFLSKDSGLPIVSLASFETPKESLSLLPLVFSMHRGALPFEVMNTDVLVALLNPYDAVLQAEVKRTTGRTCHFYLVSPAEYDTTLDKIKKIFAAQEA